MRLDYFQSWYAAPTSAGEWFAVNIDGKKGNVFVPFVQRKQLKDKES